MGNASRGLKAASRGIHAFNLAVATLATSTLVALASPATEAHAANYLCPRGSVWESGIGGAWVNARIEFRATDICNGVHVTRAYVRIVRQCGPYKDSGRQYVYASSVNDSTLRWIQIGMGDSILWWCQTNGYYGWD